MKLIESFFDEQVKVIQPVVHGDDRGFFQESFNQRNFEKIGIKYDFVQDNHSFSKAKGTVRGLHFQTSPMQQAKLVRVVKGAALDVIVDIRPGSNTFGKFHTVEINDQNHYQVMIPAGFAHGFCTLEEDTHFCYKVDQYYSPENNAGIIYNCPEINIDWPSENPTLSAQDLKWKKLSETVL